MIVLQDDPTPGNRRRPGALGRVENEMLHDLLLEWCSNHNINPNTNEARDVAHELADLFEFGVRDHVTLREAIASR